MTAKLGKPIFHYETDPKKAEEAERDFWQKIIPLMVKVKNEEKSA